MTKNREVLNVKDKDVYLCRINSLQQQNELFHVRWKSEMKNPSHVCSAIYNPTMAPVDAPR